MSCCTIHINLHQPINLSNTLCITRLVTALCCVRNVGRGRDLRSRRSWSSISYKIYDKEERSKIEYTLQCKLCYGYVELELRIISLLGRRTHIVLCRVSRNFTSPNAVSIDARDHVVLKILAIDKDSYYNEFYLYQHLEKIGAWAVSLIVTDETDGGNGHTDTTLKLWPL